MGTISKYPIGFNSLFGVQDLGATPREITSQVVPVIDMTEFQTADKETRTVSVNVTARGNVSLFAVPTGELWRVEGFSIISGSLVAGQRIAAVLGVSTDGANTSVLSMVGRASLLGEFLVVCCTQPIFIPSGSVLDTTVTDYAGGGLVNFKCTVRFSRLRM